MSGRRPVSTFTTVANEGGLLLPDTLVRIQDAQAALGGMAPEDYGFPKSHRLKEGGAAAWNNALAHWRSFQVTMSRLEATSDRGTTETREWVQRLLTELGYGRLAYRAAAEEIAGARYSVSHRAGGEPDAPAIHIVTFGQDLNRPVPPAEDAARRSPQLLVQGYLNASDRQLWGLVTNGLRVRLLRDSHQLGRQSYIEFDLEGMFSEANYADFQLLYLLLHRTRFQADGQAPEVSHLERWRTRSREEGTRARELLSKGVEKAIEALGQGFVEHPDNVRLRETLANGGLSLQDYYRQLLRLVYRLLFLTVAEERDLLFGNATGNPVGADLVSARLADDGAVGVARPRADTRLAAAAAPTTTHDGAVVPDRVVAQNRDLYLAHYSIERLRKLADRLPLHRNDVHTDLWRGLLVLFDVLRDDRFGRLPGLEPLGGGLFDYASCPDIADEPQRYTTPEDRYDLRPQLTNARLLEAIRGLSVVSHGHLLSRVNYRDMDVEELGSVYESLLDREPVLTVDGRFTYAPSGERKSTGSYYTPSSLVRELIASALEPVLADALAKGKTVAEKRRRLLALKICDPACGSGHFLLAAARRLGQELAALDAPEGTLPGPEAIRAAMREVIRRCIYGVDKNPLAVDLCKTALWIEGHAPGEPLGFLDHRIRNGDSLIGVFDLEVLDTGIPDAAYAPVTGDEKAVATGFRKTNRIEAGKFGSHQRSLGEGGEANDILAGWSARIAEIDALPDHTVMQVKAIEQAYRKLLESDSRRYLATACDLWVHAFFAPLTKGSPVPTSASVRQAIDVGPDRMDRRLVSASLTTAALLPVFHWPLEFPDVINKTKGGFDVVLGNPPWERVKLQEQEFFATADETIAKAPNKAARDRLIKALPDTNPALWRDFVGAKRTAENASVFMRGSERFEKTGRGDVNLYSIFAEHFRKSLNPTGQAGIIVPTGIATDDTNKAFFGDLVDKGAIATLFDFENSKPVFAGVHRSYKFSLLVIAGPSRAVSGFNAAFFLTDPAELRDANRTFPMTAADIALINPNTRTSPIFRNRRDAEITKAIYRRTPVLINEGLDVPGDTASVGRKVTPGNPWGVTFKTMFHMSNDSYLFRTREQLEAEGYVLGADGRFRKPLYVHSVEDDTPDDGA